MRDRSVMQGHLEEKSRVDGAEEEKQTKVITMDMMDEMERETLWTGQKALSPDAMWVVMTEDEDKTGISLAKSSRRKQFCPSIKPLTDRGLKPSQVITRFRTWEVKTNGGAFKVVKPAPVGPNSAGGENDGIPF